MITCDRCGKKIKNPLMIRYARRVGFIASVFNRRMDDFNLCPGCAASFRRWLFMRIEDID